MKLDATPTGNGADFGGSAGANPVRASRHPDEELKAARDRVKANGAALARQEVPMATEPAFQFKA